MNPKSLSKHGKGNPGDKSSYKNSSLPTSRSQLPRAQQGTHRDPSTGAQQSLGLGQEGIRDGNPSFNHKLST